MQRVINWSASLLGALILLAVLIVPSNPMIYPAYLPSSRRYGRLIYPQLAMVYMARSYPHVHAGDLDWAMVGKLMDRIANHQPLGLDGVIILDDNKYVVQGQEMLAAIIISRQPMELLFLRERVPVPLTVL